MTGAGHTLRSLDELAPSAALKLTRFSELDAFRPAELTEDARSIPLDPANFSSARAQVALPGCAILVQSSFARILDLVYRAPGGLVVVPLEDEIRASLKGVALDSRSFFALRGTDQCQFTELKPNLLAIIVLSPQLADRGWFDCGDRVQAFSAGGDALMAVRRAISNIVHTASSRPNLFLHAPLAVQLQECLLAGLDELFTAAVSDRPIGTVRRRHVELMRRIDDYLRQPAAMPVYSAELAAELEVSLRTLGAVVSQVRGMSLHRYIRLRKLWSVRGELVRPRSGVTVSASARANGFHHMGEFAALYRATFNETPSQTLAAVGRRMEPPAIF